MKKTFLATSLALSLPLSIPANAAPKSEMSAGAPLAHDSNNSCPKSEWVLACTSKGEVIRNPKMNYFDKERSPSDEAVYVIVIINETDTFPIETSVTLDFNGNLIGDLFPSDHSKTYSVNAVYSEAQPGGKCVYKYYDDITSIALSTNPSASQAIRDILKEAAHLAVSPDYVYHAPLFDDHPKCPLMVSSASPIMNANPS